MAEEMFKATLMGGFDKDDVLAKVQKMKDEAYAEKNKLIKAGKDKDKKSAFVIIRRTFKFFYAVKIVSVVS